MPIKLSSDSSTSGYNPIYYTLEEQKAMEEAERKVKHEPIHFPNHPLNIAEYHPQKRWKLKVQVSRNHTDQAGRNVTQTKVSGVSELESIL